MRSLLEKMRRPPAVRSVLVVTSLLGVVSRAELAEDWALPPTELRDNGLRGEVILNAFWERRPEGAGEPERVRVPHVYGKTGTNEYSRALVLPSGWEGRRLVLETGGFTSSGSVAWNGATVGTVPAGSSWTEIVLPGAVAGPQRLALTTGLVRGNTWLRSFPDSAATIEDSYLTTSVRRREVTVEMSGRAPAGSWVEPVVRIADDAGLAHPVKELLGPSPVVADAEGVWRTRLIAAWPDAKLWSQWEPNLYWYAVEVRVEGKPVDAQLPRLFGFREVWVEGKTVFLNGAPLRFTGDTWNGLVSRDGNAMRQQCDAIMPRLKAVGITAGHRLENDVALEACARHGVVTMAYAGGLNIPIDWPDLLKPGEAGDEGGDAELRALKDDKLEASIRNLERRIRRWRENPAVLCWSVRSPWNRSTLNSLMQGNVADPWRYWPGNGDEAKNRLRYEVAERTITYVRRFDPHRPVGTQNSPGSDIEWSTRYLCINLDLQERASFFDRWSQDPTARALWPAEYQEVFHGHQFIRKTPLQIPQNDRWPTIHVENAAREFGEGVYLEPSDDELRRWNMAWGDVFAASSTYQRLQARNAWHAFRGWRTAGVSGFAHWQLREGYKASTTLKKIEARLGLPREVDPRQAGFSQAVGDVDKPTSFPIPGVDVRLAGGEAYERAIAPFLVYIGGGQGSWNNRDHLYWAGAPVRKNIVALNDFQREVRATVAWSLEGPGGTPVAGGSRDIIVPPGDRKTDGELAFSAPPVKARTDFVLRLSVKDDRGVSQTDEFPLTVFPALPDRPEHPVGNVWMLRADGVPADTVQETWAARHGARILSASETSLPRDAVLVVARRALSDAGVLARLATLEVDRRVTEGLRLLVLEQTGTNVFGLATENVRPRTVFPAATGHPAFDGLSGSDLSDWTGASDLDPGAEPIDERTRLVFPGRIWHVNGENAVATRTFVRPQVGACRALAVSGFDLMETPLLEVAKGRGRMVFCQLDVSNRYGIDPVATRILDNLLGYLASAPEPDPGLGELITVKADGPGVELRPETFRMAKPEGPDGWGITQAEMFNREAIYAKNWVTKRRLPGLVPVFGEGNDGRLPRVIRRESDGRLATTLEEASFETGWARRKVAWVRSALVVNQGGSRLDGPSLTAHGDATLLYPHRWVEGFVHPYTAACW